MRGAAAVLFLAAGVLLSGLGAHHAGEALAVSLESAPRLDALHIMRLCAPWPLVTLFLLFIALEP